MLCKIFQQEQDIVSSIAPGTGQEDLYLEALETPLYLSETADI